MVAVATMMTSTTRRGAAVIALVMLLSALAVPAHAAPSVGRQLGDDGWTARQIRKGGILQRDRALAERLPGRARLGYHPETRRVRFLSGTPSKPLTKGVAAVASGRRSLSVADAKDKARTFVDRYGSLFGLRQPGRELRVKSTRRRLATSGSTTASASLSSHAAVRFGQVRGGVPVLGGEIVVQLSDAGEVVSAVGEVLPSAASVDTRPSLTAGKARTIATTWLARESGRAASAVTARSDGLALYDGRVMGNPDLVRSGARLVWQVDARIPAAGGRAREHRLVLVDAQVGGVLTSMSRINGVDRYVCDNRNKAGKSYRCSAPFTRKEGQGPVGISDVDAAYRLMGVVESYFRDRFGRDGIDDKGSRMKATVRYCPSFGCPWRNAEWHWSDQQAVFGRGWAKADDIVAHEYAHGVLDHEAPFFYHYQSGALNESFADIFGELIDLSYSGGKDTAWTRWKIGEDTPVGIFRDMRNPPRFGHPDRVRSPLWHKSNSDFGGVHRNNGVGNKAATLIADGGNFRGYKIKGIGRSRTARVYYQALTTRLTSAADYIDLADALVAACTDLTGSHGFTFGHCKAVSDATKATQMHLAPRKFPPKVAPVCGSGKRPIDVFNDDLEDPGSGQWLHQRLAGSTKGWYYPQNPNNRASWDGTWASSGKRNLYAPNRSVRSDAVMKMTTAPTLPQWAFLRFEHGFGFDKDAKRRYDGGMVQIKVDDGPWRAVNSLFSHGGYNGKVAKGFGNRLAGKRAYTGNSHGWASARIKLFDFAGSNVRVRFRMASDRAVGGFGWYIDDVRIYTCVADNDKPTGTLSLDGDAVTTSDSLVAVAVSAADATTWLTKLRISNSGKSSASGYLSKGITMPWRETLEWDLSDVQFGGSGHSLGTKHVYAQVRDAGGNWSDAFSSEIELVAEP